MLKFSCGCLKGEDMYAQEKTGFSGMGTHSGGIAMEPLMPGATLSDKLRLAASKGQINDAQELYRAGAVFDVDRDGRTALHYAALNGYLDVTRFLLERGCPIDAQDASGYTALHRAASQGHLEVITLLLEAGCDPNTQDEHGNAAVHEAAWNGFSKTLEVLVKHNVNVAVTNKAGFSALHLSAQNGHNESSRVLLYAGCNSDHKNNYGDTALHTASRYGHAGVTRILISARAKLNEPNKNGDTVLHIAAALKRRKIAKLLVESGIDVHIRNKQNETAVDVARRKEHDEVISIIQAFSRPKAPRPRIKEVNFKDDLHEIDGPVVVPDQELPGKPEVKPEKGKKFFFFKKKKTKEKEKQSGGITQQKPVPADKNITVGKTPVRGFFSQYEPRSGEQYYRDLAGNIKKGPIGYSPTCHCMPSIQQLEKRVDSARDNVYERIQSTNQALNDRIDQVDHRSSMRVHALEQYTRERFTEEENFCRNRINQRIDSGVTVPNGDNMKMQIQDWLEQKLEDYGHCLNHHHDDSALPGDNIFTHIQETVNGRLFRSRSDETLSQSDNHSGHFRKKDFYESRQAAMQQIRAWQVPQYSRDRNKVRIQQKQSQKIGAQQVTMHQNQNQKQTYNQVHSQHDRQPSRQQNQRFPIEAKVEIRNSAKNLDSQAQYPPYKNADSQNMADSNYMTMSGVQNQGAIPKRVTQSQSWQNVHFRQNSSARGPVTHSTPKSRESSPFENPRTVVHSHTDSAISRHSRENSRPRQLIPTDNGRDSLLKQSEIKQTSSFKQSDINLGNSQTSDKLQSSLRKPTFTTFGYDEAAKDGRTAPTNSPEQNMTSDDIYLTQADLLPTVQSGSCNSPRSNGYKDEKNHSADNQQNDSSRPYSRQESHASFGFEPSNKDDLHLSSAATQFSILKQRTRSTEGLLADSSLSNNSAKARLFTRSQSEDRFLDSADVSQQSSSPRSSSESRGALNSSVHTSSSAITSHSSANPSYTQSNSYGRRASTPAEDPFNRSNSYGRRASTPLDSNRDYNSSTWAGSQAQMESNANKPYHPYVSMHEIPRGGTKDPRAGLINQSNRNVNTHSDTHYSTVRDVKLQKDNNHNITVKADVHNVDQNIYYSHESLGGQAANLEPRSQTAYQTYLTGPELYSSKDNLRQRENSPNVCNNSKEDSSSNPDSGYSSKIYGTRAGSVNPASTNTTPSSSFSTDRGISTPSNTNSPHSTYSNPDYQHLPSQQYQDEIQTQVQSWYKRKLQEATQRCYDNWKAENSPRKINQSGDQNYKGVYYSNDNYANSRPAYQTRNYGDGDYRKISQNGEANYQEKSYGNDDYAQISHFSRQSQYGNQSQYSGQAPLVNGYGFHNNGSHLISTYSRGSDV